jgi:thiol:disulfide interchange protein/DsbC/DsbD-like thiol-disulfide interchange protein
MHRFLKLSLALVPALAWAPAAFALESAPITTPHAEVTLASEVDAVEPGKPFRLGLHFKLAKGWHIYWNNPGSAGEPPQIDLDLPAGTKASAIDWPAPERVPEGPAMTYSYLGEVLLPFTVTTPMSLKALPIEAKVSWLICETICVPEEGRLHLDLPVGAVSQSPQAPLFHAADARIPRPSTFAATISPDTTLSLRGDGISAASVHEAWFLPADWGMIDDLAAQKLAVSDGMLTLGLKPGPKFDPKANFAGVVVLTDSSGKQNFQTIATAPDTPLELHPTVSASSAQQAKNPAVLAPAGGEDLGLVTLLAFAFLGGLILNLMPCVFPILALKATSIASLSGHDRGKVRAHAASYTLGVLAAFAALAGLLLALRSAGVVVGWGFQYQSPAFVAAMVWLLLAVGLNLSGVFELSGRFSGAGQNLTMLGGHAGSFFTGFLAVLVATPCTAPFMGAAVAAAVSAPPPIMMLIFLAMGLGLAAPYGLFGLVPSAARLLPKPGRWMQVMKQVLAFPMYGAAAWLVWVISLQSGSDGTIVALSGAVLIGFAAWLFGATQRTEGRWHIVGLSGAAAATILAIGLLWNITATPPSASALAEADQSTAYSASRLAALRDGGRPVFVNMTAAWCVTCLVNERLALSSDAVKQAFSKRNVAYLKGDWTRADPAISKYLQEHGRDGVPLYVLYPPAGRSPIVLPQVLTEKIVLDELERLGS